MVESKEMKFFDSFNNPNITSLFGLYQCDDISKCVEILSLVTLSLAILVILIIIVVIFMCIMTLQNSQANKSEEQIYQKNNLNNQEPTRNSIDRPRSQHNLRQNLPKSSSISLASENEDIDDNELYEQVNSQNQWNFNKKRSLSYQNYELRRQLIELKHNFDNRSKNKHLDDDSDENTERQSWTPSKIKKQRNYRSSSNLPNVSTVEYEMQSRDHDKNYHSYKHNEKKKNSRRQSDLPYGFSSINEVPSAKIKPHHKSSRRQSTLEDTNL